MNSTAEAPPQILVRPLIAVGRWWWSRWTRSQNPTFTGLAAVVWLMVIGATFVLRAVLLRWGLPDGESAHDVMPWVIWFTFVALGHGVGALAHTVRGQAPELTGRRKDLFLMLTSATVSICLLSLIYFLVYVV